MDYVLWVISIAAIEKTLIFFNVLPEKNKNFGLGVFGYTGRNLEASRMLENQ